MKPIQPWHELYEADCESNTNGIATFSCNNYMQDEIDLLRIEVARIPALEKAINFQDAVACVFDSLKFAAANTSDKSWDDQLEELAEDVIEYAPEYKKQWKDIGQLCKQVRELTEFIIKFQGFVEGAPVSSGVCCCGDSMESHNAYSDHSPVDTWDNGVKQFSQEMFDLINKKSEPKSTEPVNPHWPADSAEQLASFKEWLKREGEDRP